MSKDKQENYTKLKKEEIADFLVENNEQEDLSDQIPALHHAIFVGKNDRVKWLIEHKALVNAFDASERSPLLIAAYIGEEKIVNLLIDNNSKLDFFDNKGNSALHVAACKDKENIVKILLDNKIAIDHKNNAGETALHGAVNTGIIQ